MGELTGVRSPSDIGTKKDMHTQMQPSEYCESKQSSHKEIVSTLKSNTGKKSPEGKMSSEDRGNSTFSKYGKVTPNR